MPGGGGPQDNWGSLGGAGRRTNDSGGEGGCGVERLSQMLVGGAGTSAPVRVVRLRWEGLRCWVGGQGPALLSEQ